MTIEEYFSLKDEYIDQLRRIEERLIRSINQDEKFTKKDRIIGKNKALPLPTHPLR